MTHNDYFLHARGRSAEKAACDYLISQGLSLVKKNYSAKNMGEIDLIMQDQNVRVFVEVRQRTNRYYASALESVNWTKQKKMIKTALFYLQSTHELDTIACRFDVVGVDYKNGGFSFEWVQDAFQY